jgi:hypothetical protein
MAALVFQGANASVDVLRQGQVFIPDGTATINVPDTALTNASVIVATLGPLGSGAVSTQGSVTVRNDPANLQFIIVLPGNAAATGQYVNWVVLKY